MVLYLQRLVFRYYNINLLIFLQKVVFTSTIIMEMITLINSLLAYIELYGNHHTINSIHEHVQPPLPGCQLALKPA